jgi:hypothetical protein
MIKPRTQSERSVVVLDVVLVVFVVPPATATATTFCGYRGIRERGARYISSRISRTTSTAGLPRGV